MVFPPEKESVFKERTRNELNSTVTQLASCERRRTQEE
jgi:hypothetical protein